MWCKSCNIETNEEICPVCGNYTVEDEDITTKVYWCRRCNIPVIQKENQADKGICPL